MSYSRWYHNGIIWTLAGVLVVCVLMLAEWQLADRSERPTVIAIGVPENADEDGGNETDAAPAQHFDSVAAMRAEAKRLLADREAGAAALVAVARQAREFRDYATAGRLLRLAMERQPENVEALFLHGRTLSDLGDKVGAQATYRQVLARAATHQKASFNLALLLRDSGQLPAAEQAFVRTAAIASGRLKSKALYQAGLLQLRTGRAETASVSFRQAIALRPQQHAYWLGLGEAQLAQGLLEDAGEALGKALALNRREPETLLALARLGQARGDTRAALRYIKKAARMDPSSPAVRQAMATRLMGDGDSVKAQEQYRWLSEHAGNDADRAFYDGMLAFLAQDERRMRELLQKADQLRPGHYDAALEQLATLLGDKKQIESASVLFDTLLGRSPRSPRLLVAAAENALRRGQAAEAGSLVSRALAIDDKSASAWFVLARSLSVQGRNREAIDAYRRSLAIEPAGRNARLNLAVLLSRDGRDAEALVVYDRLLEEHPRYVPALANRARVHERAGRLDAAYRDLERAVGVAPEDVEVKVRLAGLLLKRGDPQLAANVLRDAVATSPEALDARLLLADAELALGHRAEAHTQLVRAAALATRDARPWIARARLLLAGSPATASQQDLRAALALIDKALAIDPKNNDALVERGRLLQRLSPAAENTDGGQPGHGPAPAHP